MWYFLFELGGFGDESLGPEELPTFEQISEARKNYALVRNHQGYRTTFRSTFNEGGVLESAAENRWLDKPLLRI